MGGDKKTIIHDSLPRLRRHCEDRNHVRLSKAASNRPQGILEIDMDAVVHMAALLHIVNPPPELREKYERVNIGGTATVVESAIKAGVKRVVSQYDCGVWAVIWSRAQ